MGIGGDGEGLLGLILHTLALDDNKSLTKCM